MDAQVNETKTIDITDDCEFIVDFNHYGNKFVLRSNKERKPMFFKASHKGRIKGVIGFCGNVDVCFDSDEIGGSSPSSYIKIQEPYRDSYTVEDWHIAREEKPDRTKQT